LIARVKYHLGDEDVIEFVNGLEDRNLSDPELLYFRGLQLPDLSSSKSSSIPPLLGRKKQDAMDFEGALKDLDRVLEQLPEHLSALFEKGT